MDTIVLPVAVCDQTEVITRAELDDEYSDSTLLRVRGHLSIYGNGTFAQGAAGIIEVEGVHSDDALPYCPLTDCDASWLWHSFWSVGTVTVTLEAATAGVMRFEIDGQAQRRLEAGDSSLWFAIENDAISNGPVSYWWGLRTLLAEK